MDPARDFRSLLESTEPILALAPMQDVTDHAFLALMQAYGGADFYVTEYFRVYPGSRLNRQILRSITHNPTGRPVVPQLIGHDIPELVRTARELQHHPVAAIDLNLGCPAPVVYRKCAGGGLLREPARIDAILGALRDAIQVPFTVKTRIGFDSPAVFDELLPLFARHSLDLLTVHARTVREMYRSQVHYEFISRAAATLRCPVLANGNVHSAAKGLAVLSETRARGLMIGRGAIRNPWIFTQLRDLRAGRTPATPTGRDVLLYLHRLYREVRPPGLHERAHIQKMKKYLNYVGIGIEPSGQFLHDMRRADSETALFGLWHRHLDHANPMPLEPFPLPLQAHDIMAGVQH
jgi:tRNA-dihydrouridine synthase